METAQIFAALNVIGLFVFAESGALTALRNDMDVFGVAMIAFVIGVGTIRDVLLNEPPLILKQDIYATAALIGAGVYVGLLAMGLGESPAALVTVSIRAAAIIFNIPSPKYARPRKSEL
jgi:uncharacterized membrane protein YeiH